MSLLSLNNPDGTVHMTGNMDKLGPVFVALGGRAAGYRMGKANGSDQSDSLTVTAETWEPAEVSAGFGDLKMDPKKAAAIAEKSEKITSLGFALPQTWFAPGTRMMQQGVNTYKRHYLQWSERPPAPDVLRATGERIQSEDRRSFTVRVGDLRMTDDGEIGRTGGPARRIEWTAWKQIFGAVRGVGVFPDGERLMREISPKLRAQIFNDRMENIDPDKEVKIGVRKNGAGSAWSIFRVVGKSFPEDGTGADACFAAAEALDGMDFRGHVEYDPSTTDLRFDAAHMVAPHILDPVVGDVFRGGIKGKTNDAGGGAFVVDPFVGRIICINCTIADAYAKGVRKSHRGSMKEAIEGIMKAANMASQVVPLFAEDWNVLRNTAIADFDWIGNLGRLSIDTKAILITDPTAPDVIRALVESGKINAKAGHSALTSAILSSFRAEPGETLADVLNAITRAAHEKVPVLVGGQLEKAAGALVPWMAQRAAIA